MTRRRPGFCGPHYEKAGSGAICDKPELDVPAAPVEVVALEPRISCSAFMNPFRACLGDAAIWPRRLYARPARKC
jgi:hypothetical protein